MLLLHSLLHPRTCVFVTVIQAQSYFASTVPMEVGTQIYGAVTKLF
jgi:hypothetical protein